MLPRSDKVYVFITVAAASALVLVSVIAAVAALTGDPKERPQYESAPAPSLVPPAESGIADQAIAVRPPISDQDYLTLHKGTRLLAPKLLTTQWRDAARQAAVTEQAMENAASDLNEFRSVLNGLKGEPAKDVTVNRPVDGKSRTSTQVRYTGTDEQGNPLEETLVSFDFFWRSTASDRWEIFEIQASISGGATTSAAPETGSDTGDGVGDQTAPDQAPEDVVPDDLDDLGSETGDGLG